LHIEVTATGFNPFNYMGSQIENVLTTPLPATVEGSFEGLALTVRAPTGQQFIVDVEDGLTTNAFMNFNYLASSYGPYDTVVAIALTFEDLTGVAPTTSNNGSYFFSGDRFLLAGRFTATQDFAFSAVTISTTETFTTTGALNEHSTPPLQFITGGGTRAAVSLQTMPAPSPGTLILFTAGGIGFLTTQRARRRRGIRRNIQAHAGRQPSGN